MFIRAKTIKNKQYAYVVKNKWTKKGPRQKVSKYLGKIIELEPISEISIEDFLNLDFDKIAELSVFEMIEAIISVELLNHGFSKKNDLWLKEGISVNIRTGRVRKNKKNVVILLNADFLCSFTLLKIIKFKSNGDEREVALSLAKAFVQAGIPIPQELFIEIFNKVYSEGQSYIIPPKVRIKKVLSKKQRDLEKRIFSDDDSDKTTNTNDFKQCVIVSGTPATGKTTLSKLIAKKLNAKYVDVNDIIKSENLSEGYDKEKDCQIIDEKKLAIVLEKLIKDSKKLLIIDSHMSHFISKEFVKLCIITRCELGELRRRLEERKYSKQKVRDNIDSEIFEICLQESFDAKHNIIEVRTDKEIDFKQIIQKIKI